MADAIAQLKKDLKLRTDLKEFHLTDEQVAALCGQQASEPAEQPCRDHRRDAG